MKRRFTKLTAFILAITLTLPFTVFAAAQDEKAASDGTDIAWSVEIQNSPGTKDTLKDTLTASITEPEEISDKFALYYVVDQPLRNILRRRCVLRNAVLRTF